MSREAGAVIFHLSIDAEIFCLVAAEAQDEGFSIHSNFVILVGDAASQFFDLGIFGVGELRDALQNGGEVVHGSSFGEVSSRRITPMGRIRFTSMADRDWNIGIGFLPFNDLN